MDVKAGEYYFKSSQSHRPTIVYIRDFVHDRQVARCIEYTYKLRTGEIAENNIRLHAKDIDQFLAPFDSDRKRDLIRALFDFLKPQ